MTDVTGNPVRDANNAYLRSLPDVCKCGHGRMEHYDGHLFCTWTLTNKCQCEGYVRTEQ